MDPIVTLPFFYTTMALEFNYSRRLICRLKTKKLNQLKAEMVRIKIISFSRDDQIIAQLVAQVMSFSDTGSTDWVNSIIHVFIDFLTIII